MRKIHICTDPKTISKEYRLGVIIDDELCAGIFVNAVESSLKNRGFKAGEDYHLEPHPDDWNGGQFDIGGHAARMGPPRLPFQNLVVGDISKGVEITEARISGHNALMMALHRPDEVIRATVPPDGC